MANPITVANPPNKIWNVTKSDTVDFTLVTSAIMVSGAGDVAVVTTEGDVVTLTLSANIMYPMRLKRVNSTNTNATGIVAFGHK